MMNKSQKERYFCSTFLNKIGIEGQEKLLNSKVFVVGAGGLGNHIVLSLAALGIGELAICDNDTVKLDNLPRQVLYDESDVGKKKVDVAYLKIKNKNSDVKVNEFDLYVDMNNAKELFFGYDIVIDATDNFKSKFVIEEACKALHIPYVSAGVSDFKGQVMVVTPNSKYSFKSLFDELPLNIDEKYIEEDRGVYPLAVSLVSDLAANEAVKYLLNIGELITDSLITVDTLKAEVKRRYFK